VLLAAGTLCAQDPPAGQTQVPTLPETRIVAEPLPTTAPEAVFPPPGDADPTALPPLTFTQSTIFGTPPVRGYLAPDTTTGTLIAVPEVELPASVSTVTSDIVHDQQILRVDDALRDVGGAIKSSDQLRPDSFVLRGFEVTSRNYRKNGLLDPTYTPRDLANVERVEILKGPSSSIYGAGQPAGMVNLITKKPLDTPYNRLQFQVGSWGQERFTLDSTGPLSIDGDENLLYRFNFAYESRDSFRDYYYNDRMFLAPALTWLVDEDTAITWEGEYLQDRRRFDTGVTFLDGSLSRVPIENFLGEPADDFQLFQDWRQSVFLDHRIDDIWTLRIGATTLFYYAPSVGTFPISQGLGPDTVARSRQVIDQFFEQYYGVTANLAAEFETGSWVHKLVLGTEQGWFISNNFRSRSSLPGLQNYPIDAVNPMYSNPPGIVLPAVFLSTYRQNRHGFYVQDLIELNEQWSLLAGLRFDHADVTFAREFDIFGIPIIRPTETDQGFDRWTPRIGLTYEHIPDVLSYYASYSRSFDPPGGGARLTDDPLLPELGEAWEVGAKYQFTPQLLGQVAWFWIQKDNFTIDTQVSTPPFFVTSQVGSLTSQGVELTLVGQITERWSTTSNYTLTDAIMRDPSNADINDSAPRNVPRHIVNLWTRYNVVQTQQQTLGGGLGMIFVDDRFASFGGQLRLPDYTRFDAGVFYRRDLWDFALYLENLFDKRYYPGSVSDFQVTPGAPFNVRAQAGVTF
jgi:iron complex outermembrane receptor protein